VVAIVVNGETIPLVQSRIADVGFVDLDIALLGADKVFVRSVSNMDVMSVLKEAKDFFGLFLSNHMRWDKQAVTFERGAWVRLYGVPLHAWNEKFFKLCVFDCVWIPSQVTKNVWTMPVFFWPLLL